MPLGWLLKPNLPMLKAAFLVKRKSGKKFLFLSLFVVFFKIKKKKKKDEKNWLHPPSETFIFSAFNYLSMFCKTSIIFLILTRMI